MVTGTGAPTQLIPLTGGSALYIAVDAQDRIFVNVGDLATPTGTVRLFDAAGTLIDASYVTGIGVGGGAIAVGPGGASAPASTSSIVPRAR